MKSNLTKEDYMWLINNPKRQLGIDVEGIKGTIQNFNITLSNGGITVGGAIYHAIIKHSLGIILENVPKEWLKGDLELKVDNIRYYGTRIKKDPANIEISYITHALYDADDLLEIIDKL